MNASELKFLLQLLKYPDYRATLGKIDAPKATNKTRLCEDLAHRDLVQYSRKITQFKIEPAGKAMLKQDVTGLPLTEQQLMVLKACETKAVKPSDITSKKWAASERQSVIDDLASKGLIKVDKFQITEVWLTDRGREFLRDEYHPEGGITISLNLLGNYLAFLRKEFRHGGQPRPTLPQGQEGHDKDVAPPSDDEILHLIQTLDHELGTENYLPIFHLRQKLNGVLSRDELDQALYRLQRQDKLEMSVLVESIHYAPDQIEAGIPQDAGGPLFFLIVNE